MPKSDAIKIRDKSKVLKKMWYIDEVKFTHLLQRFNGNLKKIAEIEQVEYRIVLNKVRHYMPYCDLYDKFEQDYTRAVDTKVRIKANALKDKIMKGFEALLDSGNEKAILQGVKDLITPIIHKQEDDDINVTVNIERSAAEVKELANKLLTTIDVEKI